MWAICEIGFKAYGNVLQCDKLEPSGKLRP